MIVFDFFDFSFSGRTEEDFLCFFCFFLFDVLFLSFELFSLSAEFHYFLSHFVIQFGKAHLKFLYQLFNFSLHIPAEVAPAQLSSMVHLYRFNTLILKAIRGIVCSLTANIIHFLMLSSK